MGHGANWGCARCERSEGEHAPGNKSAGRSRPGSASGRIPAKSMSKQFAIRQVMIRRLSLITSAGSALLPLVLANPAYASLDILPTFDSSITALGDAAAVEAAISNAAHAIQGNFANSFDVPILFKAAHGGRDGFLAMTNSTFSPRTYRDYVGLLESAAAAHPGNAALKTAVSNLGSGNKGGTDGVIVTNTVLQALGVPASDAPGGYDANGNFIGSGAFDGVITINVDQPFTYAEPVPVYDGHNVTYDATRAVEHEIDEVLGGGGSGSTLNYVSQFGTDNPDSVFTFYQGALDLYRYSAPETPSFSTSETSGAYLSVDGGATEIVGFNNFPQGDYGDFGPNIDSCAGGGFGGPAGLIQDAFSCNSETAEKFTSVSPEYSMLESIGYDPTVVPEASTWLMLLVGFGGLGFAGYRRVRELNACRECKA
jgi:hypothetical protein